MTERIKFRMPSAIKYAYVDIEGTAEELAGMDFEMVAALYANALHAFQDAELGAARLIVQGPAAEPAVPALEAAMNAAAAAMPKAEHKVGDIVTVGGLVFAKHSEPPFPEGDAAARVAKGQKPRTVAEANAMADEIIRQELGASDLDDVNAPPWEVAPKAAKPKPWEKEKPAPQAVVDIEGW